MLSLVKLVTPRLWIFVTGPSTHEHPRLTIDRYVWDGKWWASQDAEPHSWLSAEYAEPVNVLGVIFCTYKWMTAASRMTKMQIRVSGTGPTSTTKNNKVHQLTLTAFHLFPSFPST